MTDFYQIADRTYQQYYDAMVAAQKAQKELELELVEALGDMYREGYWQKADYVDGDEAKLYGDGLENLEKIAKPETSYDINYLNLYDSNQDGFEYGADETAAKTYWPIIRADFGIHIVDPDIGVSQWAFVDKIEDCYDMPWKTKISVNTNLSTIAQHSFTDVMTHIADVASQVNGKMEIYDRAQEIGPNGSIAASNLSGTLDAFTNQISGGASSWYTDEKGNMMFVAADEKSAMMLTGKGLMIASDKDEYGDWNWRTAATGTGIVADTITAGLIAAERIVTAQLMSYLNENLELSSNSSIIETAGNITEIVNGYTDQKVQEVTDGIDEKIGHRLEII